MSICIWLSVFISLGQMLSRCYEDVRFTSEGTARLFLQWLQYLTVPLARTVFPIPPYPRQDLLAFSSAAIVVGITHATVLLICIMTGDIVIFPLFRSHWHRFVWGERGGGT